MEFQFNDIQNEFQEERFKSMFKVGVEALNTLHLWEWIRYFHPESGYTWSTHDNVMKMAELTDVCGHSASSFGIMMRKLQQVAVKLVEATDCNICAICLEEDVDEKVMLTCYHKFHRNCICQVVEKCPLCRLGTVPSYLKE